MFTIIDPRLTSFTNAKSIILDICSKEDMMVASKMEVMMYVIWKNRNDKVWND